jgi:hypothetical protein
LRTKKEQMVRAVKAMPHPAMKISVDAMPVGDAERGRAGLRLPRPAISAQ